MKKLSDADSVFGLDFVIVLVMLLLSFLAFAGCSVEKHEPSRYQPIWIFQGDRAYTPQQWEQHLRGYRD